MNVCGPVQLSTTLHNLLCLAHRLHEINEVQLNEVQLKHVVALIDANSVEELNIHLSVYDEYEPIDIDSIKVELQKLVDEWSLEYDVVLLLEINNTGLKTHMKAGEIGINHGFEIDGPQGDGGKGIRKQWKRIENPLDHRVLAIVTYAYDETDGKTEVFDTDIIVRPHYGGPRSDNHVGSSIPTPEEVLDHKQKWDDYRKASDLIDERVHARIHASDEKAEINLTYSCYKSDDRDVPIDNLDEVAIEGKAIITQLSNDEDHGDYESPIVENPTWLDVCVLFNKAIPLTGDYHHSFLEGVYKTKDEKDGVPIYRFSTGS